MTMAPGRKKRGYWLEIILVSILLFLLMGSRSQTQRSTGVRTDFKNPLQRSLIGQSLTLK
jgi:hypothetical protein